MRSHFPFVTKKRVLGTLDNIYVLNYLVNRQVSRVGGKMVAFFIALRTTFDSVDRERLVKAMRERGVKEEGLVVKYEDMLRETRSKVRVGRWEVNFIREGG